MKLDEDAFSSHDDRLLGGLGGATRQLLLQLLMYKSIFLSSSFRSLSQEEPREVAEALLRIHTESASEAVGLTIALRDWDAIPAGQEGLEEVAADARRRFLEDMLSLKDGVVDVGLVAAMRAPTAELRERLLQLADIDRRHADALRGLLGSRTVTQHLARHDTQSDGLVPGIGVGRPTGGSLRSAIQEAMDAVRARGTEPALLAVSAETMRHARDEGLIDVATGRAFGVPVEVDMAWRGECFAVETLERVGYAELLTAAATGEAAREPGSRS